MDVIKPPQEIDEWALPVTLFLAGSIEQGKASNWQSMVEKHLKDLPGVIWNPRRNNWDATWEQSLNNKQFVEQVKWEWFGLNNADIVVVYFDPDTQSPITLMELGLLSGLAPENTLVYCPEGFWRKGNVDVVCQVSGITVYEDRRAFLDALRDKVIEEIES